MGFRQHGITVAISSAQQKNTLPPGSKHGAYGEKSRPGGKGTLREHGRGSQCALRGGGRANKTDVELKSGCVIDSNIGHS
jgi:hypothetical protein